jgi:hypothetical protein
LSAEKVHHQSQSTLHDAVFVYVAARDLKNKDVTQPANVILLDHDNLVRFYMARPPDRHPSRVITAINNFASSSSSWQSSCFSFFESLDCIASKASDFSLAALEFEVERRRRATAAADAGVFKFKSSAAEIEFHFVPNAPASGPEAASKLEHRTN